MSRPSTTVLVPVKAFDQAKGRLDEVLDAAARAELAREMATHVVTTAAPLPVAVVCEDPEVKAWAESLDAEVIEGTTPGLNAAVRDGVAHLGAAGVERVVVAHSDLPMADDLAWAAEFPGVTIVPDRHDDGTNVLAVPTAAGFRFSYGPGSYPAHLAEARRCGLGVRVERVAALGWDVDTPDDLAYGPVGSRPAAPRR